MVLVNQSNSTGDPLTSNNCGGDDVMEQTDKYRTALADTDIPTVIEGASSV